MSDLPPAASDSGFDYDALEPASSGAGEALRELRARAERRRLVTSAPPATPADMQRLVQELQVHQIELEMQYEELLLAQAQAEASRAQYLDLYEFAPVGYCTLDAAGTLCQLNLRTAQLLGLVRQQLQGRRLALFVEARQRPGFNAFLARLLAAAPDTRHSLTLALVRPDGQPLELRLEATRAPDAGPGQPLVRLALLDVTEQQQATRALAQSEKRLRQALDAAAMGVVSWDFATDEWQADARAQAIWGLPYAAAPRPADTVAAHLHPADRPRFRQLAETGTSPADLEVELRVLDAQRPDRYVSLTGHVQPPTPASPRGCLLGLVRDRTPRRRTEQELNYKNRLLDHMLSHFPVQLGRLGPDGCYRELVGAGLRRLQLADNELVGQSIFDTFPTIADYSRRLLAGESVSFVGSAELNGELLSFQSYGFFDTERDEAIVFALDVTEREQQRAALEREQQFAQSLLDHSVDALIALDTEQRVTAWNRQAALYTGVAAAQALGRPLGQVLPLVADDPGFRALLAGALAGARGQLPNWQGRYFVGKLDLHLRPFSSPTQEARGVLLTARDVTQREQLLAEATRQQLRQQQLVLSAILTTQEEERRRIAEALHNGVGQLLYATRLHLTQLPDSEALRAGQQLLQEAIRSTRTISFELTPRILEDFGLPAALRELADRVPAGQLCLALELAGLAEEDAPLPPPVQMAAYRIVQELLSNVMKHAQARHATLAVARQPNQLHIRITDDGVGFVPAPTSGGIGLAGIRNRVELLGGTLGIKSAPALGTSIEIELPLA